MIDRETFRQGMTILQDRYNRVLAAPTLAAYYSRLSPVLTDAEFTAGITLAIDAPFMPSPDDIITAVKPEPDRKVEAEDLWNRVRAAMRRGPWREIARSAFTDVEWKVIAAVGGLDALSNMTYESEPHVHRRFLDAYVERATSIAKQERATVPLASMDAGVQQLVGDVTKRIGGGHAR